MFTLVVQVLLNTLYLSQGIDKQVSTRIEFGSCIFPKFEQPLWRDIVKRDPDLFIFTGDATYLDYDDMIFDDPIALWKWTSLAPFYQWFQQKQQQTIPDPSKYKSIWRKTYENKPYFEELINNKHCEIIGVYDDHDYGYNDAIYDNPYKKEAKQSYIDFLNLTDKISDDSLKREGLYYHYPLKISSINKIIDIILLDIHYFNGLEKDDDILGSKQWKWLQEIMDIDKYLNGNSKLKGDFVLIISGQQLLPIYKGMYNQNIWSQTSYSMQKLFKNILLPWMKNENTKNKLLFITGDVHYGELNKIICINNNNNNDYFNIKEITSSSMNAPFASQKGDTPLLFKWFFDLYFKFENDLISECRNLEKNFGEIEFKWIFKEKEWFIDKIWMRLIGENNDIGCEKEINLQPISLENIASIEQTIPLFNIINTDYRCYSEGRINYTIFQLGIRNIMLQILVALLIYFPLIISALIVIFFMYYYPRMNIIVHTRNNGSYKGQSYD